MDAEDVKGVQETVAYRLVNVSFKGKWTKKSTELQIISIVA